MDSKWKFEVWYDGCCLHEENGFDTEYEAREEAQMYVEAKIEDWKVDGVYDYNEPPYFDIEVMEV